MKSRPVVWMVAAFLLGMTVPSFAGEDETVALFRRYLPERAQYTGAKTRFGNVSYGFVFQMDFEKAKAFVESKGIRLNEEADRKSVLDARALVRKSHPKAMIPEKLRNDPWERPDYRFVSGAVKDGWFVGLANLWYDPEQNGWVKESVVTFTKMAAGKPGDKQRDEPKGMLQKRK